MSPMVKLPLAEEYALLGFVQQRPLHAYEIYRQLMQDQALGRVWHLKQSQLYALLTRLEDEGYLTSTMEPQGTRPPRKILHLTPSGRAAFMRWLTTPVAHGRDFRLEFLAKLFFASQQDPATATDLILRQRQDCEAWIRNLQAQVGALSPEETYDALVLQFRIKQIEGILSWLDICAETLTVPA